MISVDKPTTLPYFGGKSGLGPSGVGKWLCDRLPYKEAYAEPFAGMLGVLLSRRRSYVEIVNDIDGLIFGWWVAVRDHSEELHRRLRATPYAEDSVAEALHYLKAWGEPDTSEPDPIDAACVVAVLCAQTIGRRLIPDAKQASGCFRKSSPTTNSTHGFGFSSPATSWVNYVEAIPALSARMTGVEIERRDAVLFCERLASAPNLVLYVDPPYRAECMHNRRYYRHDVDADMLLDVLLTAKSAVGVSGYAGDRWQVPLEEAGWQRSELKVSAYSGSENGQRTEMLWTNYPIASQSTLFQVDFA